MGCPFSEEKNVTEHLNDPSLVGLGRYLVVVAYSLHYTNITIFERWLWFEGAHNIVVLYAVYYPNQFKQFVSWFMSPNQTCKSQFMWPVKTGSLGVLIQRASRLTPPLVMSIVSLLTLVASLIFTCMHSCQMNGWMYTHIHTYTCKYECMQTCVLILIKYTCLTVPCLVTICESATKCDYILRIYSYTSDVLSANKWSVPH